MLYNIQALRAFAALNVVLFHIIGTSASYQQGVLLFSFLEGWGASGVDVFFVISGFVMVYTQYTNAKAPSAFLRGRFIRIIPIYWILTCTLLFLLLLFPSIFRELKPSTANALASLFFVSKVLEIEHPLLYVGWTLEYEMLFYALFAIGLLSTNRRISFAAPAVALLLLSMAGVIDLIAIEFVFGMLCAKLYLENKWRRFGGVIFAAGAALLFISIFLKPEHHRVWVWGLPSLLLVFGATSIRQLKNKPLVYLGNASYSIYLVQVFTIPAFYKLSSKVFIFIQNDILAVASLILSVAFGCVVHQYVEAPIGKILRKRSMTDAALLAKSPHTIPHNS